MSALLVGLLAGLAVLVWSPPSATARLAQVLPRPAPASCAPPPGRLARLRDPAGACILAALALVLLVGGLAGALLGLGCVVAGPRLLAGLEPASARAEREQLAADLPVALDLLAACLGGGASTRGAVRAVAEAVPGPAGERFAQVAAALDVGAPVGEAWERLAGSGGDDGLAEAAARALTRAAGSGAPVADAVVRLAESARAAERSRREQAAARAGVLAVAPLGLCFLPAFVLLGIVPVVVGLIGPVLGAL